MSRSGLCVLVVILMAAASFVTAGAAAGASQSDGRSLRASLHVPGGGLLLPPLCVAVDEERVCGTAVRFDGGDGQLGLTMDYTLSSLAKPPEVSLRVGRDIPCSNKSFGSGLVAELSPSSLKHGSLVEAAVVAGGETVSEVQVPVRAKEREPRVVVSFCG